ncbi:MAG: acetylglutamate kinase [Candidatus Omnitrophica bacterium]|nr:acetylglutamate kinase [Candidatus Omnitrophota bacterium]
MQEAIRKTEVLIEALPYIEAFRDKAVVIKYGGSAIVDARKRKNVLEDIIFMSCSGMKPVIVHGGGPFINKKLKKKGIRSEFVNGLRVTDERSLKVIKEVLTRVNRQIVREIRSLGGKAQGLTVRSRVIKAKRNSRFGDIGFVGEITSIDTHKLKELFDRDVIPVIAPFGMGRDGKTYNVNADLASASVASSLGAEKLALLTNVDGIFRDRNDKDSLISTVGMRQVRNLIRRGIIDTGMIPKVMACVSALKKGVNKIHIINAGLSHALLLEIFTDEGIGTQIVKSKRKKR